MGGIVYFLKTESREKWVYVGSTDDLDRRLYEHEQGLVSSTGGFRPLLLIYKENFSTLDEARKREYFFKGWKGRIEKIIESLY